MVAGGRGMADMRLIVVGAGGRMGRTLVKAIAEHQGLSLAAAMEAKGSQILGQDAGVLAGLAPLGIKVSDDIQSSLASADGIIDFTIPAATVAHAELAARNGLVHIIGTTGLEAEHENKIAEASQNTVVVKSGNMSLGVNLLAALVRRVAMTLDQDFDIEILEMHHNKKIAAPSGPALL